MMETKALQWLQDHGYDVSSRVRFFQNCPHEELKAAALPSVWLWCVWDPQDDEQGFFLHGDNLDEIILEAATHLGYSIKGS